MIDLADITPGHCPHGFRYPIDCDKCDRYRQLEQLIAVSNERHMLRAQLKEALEEIERLRKDAAHLLRRCEFCWALGSADRVCSGCGE